MQSLACPCSILSYYHCILKSVFSDARILQEITSYTSPEFIGLTELLDCIVLLITGLEPMTYNHGTVPRTEYCRME
jgi:hypothetical protein